MIGTHYHKHGYNCANFVAEWYKINLDIDIPVINEFDRSFVVWMRRHFVDVSMPSKGDLALMVNHSGEYHVGVYYNGYIHHNFKPSKGLGSVVKWTVLSARSYYKKVSFHTWSQ